MASIYQKFAMTVAGTVLSFVAMDANPAQAALIGNTIRLSEELNSNSAVLPSLAYNSTEQEYLAVWEFLPEGLGPAAALQRFSPTGSLIGENVRISQLAQTNLDPIVAYNSLDNQYLVTFRVQDPLFPVNSSVGQLLTADGESIGDNFFISEAGFESSLVYNSEVNEYFQTSRLFGDNFPSEGGIFWQRIGADGTLVSSGTRLDVGNSPDSSAPNGQVAFNRVDDRYLATWRRQSDGLAIEGQLIDTDGTPIDDKFEIVSANTFTSGITPFSKINLQFDPVNTQFLAVYDIPQEQQIRGQLVDADGTPIGSEILINENFLGELSITFSESLETYLLTGWGDSGLFGQFISASGNLVGNPFTISSASDIFGTSAVFNEDTQEFLVAWGDMTEPAIYAQRINTAPSKPTSVPESHSAISLLVFGAFGIHSLLKKRSPVQL